MSEAIFPASKWQDPVEPGLPEEHRAHLVRELSAGGSTALIIVEGGKPVFQWGDLALKSSVASVRKSLISILYGIYVAEGRIKLDATLQDLRIDDIGGLTDRERQATVGHLLQARSGVYPLRIRYRTWPSAARRICAG